MKDVVSEEELVAHLNIIIDEELDRPEHEQDLDLIEECVAFLCELMPRQKSQRRAKQVDRIVRMISASE